MLAGTSVSLEQSERVGLIGLSGSGKSTLALILSGLLRPDSGEVYFGTEPLSGMKMKERKKFHCAVQLIFQSSFSALNPRKKIGWLMEEPGKIHFPYLTPTRMRARVAETFQALDLDASLLDRYPSELSGGQCQRVLIARALTLRPRFLLCDEILGSLDVLTQVRVLDLLKKLSSDWGMGLFFISHDHLVVKGLCKKVFQIERGRCVAVQEKEAIPSVRKREGLNDTAFDAVEI